MTFLDDKSRRKKFVNIDNRLRDALKVWHPDKFNQLTQSRVRDEEERKKMSDVVTHVSQVLINYGKTNVS